MIFDARAFLALGLLSCASVRVTPEAIQASGASPDIKARAEQTWREAVRMLNEFVASPYNLSLPRGAYVLDDREGLRFETDEGVWPVAVTCDWLGDLISFLGGRAASLGLGFVVAKTRGPTGARAIDNTMFQLSDGEWLPAHRVASVIAHETGHLIHGRGFWKNVGYACEAIVMLRTSSNSAEIRPRATTEEFRLFRRLRGYERPRPGSITPLRLRALLVKELLEDRGDHGPYVGSRPEPVLPGRRAVAGGVALCPGGVGSTECERWLSHSQLALDWYVEARLLITQEKLRDRLDQRAMEFRELVDIVTRILGELDADPDALRRAKVQVREEFQKAENAISLWQANNALERDRNWIPEYLAEQGSR